MSTYSKIAQQLLDLADQLDPKNYHERYTNRAGAEVARAAAAILGGVSQVACSGEHDYRPAPFSESGEPTIGRRCFKCGNMEPKRQPLGPITAYVPCAAHAGMSWSMQATCVTVVATVCPICHPPGKPSGGQMLPNGGA